MKTKTKTIESIALIYYSFDDSAKSFLEIIKKSIVIVTTKFHGMNFDHLG